MLDYLRDLANVTVLVASGSARDVLGNPEAIGRLDRVVVADDIAGAAEARQALAAVGAEVFRAADYLGRTQPKIVIADTLHPVLSACVLPNATLILRAEIVAHALGGADFALPTGSYRRMFVGVPAISAESAVLAASAGATPLLAPCFVCRRQSGIPVPRMNRDTKAVAILGAPHTPAVELAAVMARAHGIAPHLVHGFGDEASSSRDAAFATRADRYIASLLARRMAAPRAVIDLSSGRLGFALCREVLELMHVPVVEGSMTALQPALGNRSGHAATECGLWAAIRSLACESESGGVRHIIDYDGEWYWLQRMSNALFAA
jgi:hypothetical protein